MGHPQPNDPIVEMMNELISEVRALRSEQQQHASSLLTIAEAAQALRQSTRTIKRLIAAGRLRVAKLALGGSGRVLVPRAELDRLVAASML